MRVIFAAVLAACLLGASAARADVKSGVDAWNQGDYARAVGEWRPLAISGNADAQFNLGQAYKLGRGVPVDLPMALEWYRKASEQGHQQAADNYGLLLFQQGKREDAMPYVKASAERGEPRAQYVYATALFNGDLAPRDWVRAYALMTRAAASGVTQAQTSLTQMNQYIPEEQRRDGLELAAAMAQGRAPGTQRGPIPASPPASPPALAQAAPSPAPAPAVPATKAPPPPAPPGSKPAPTVIDHATLAANQTPASRPPVRKAPPPAQPAVPASAAPRAPAPPPAAGGRWRVQLGAFREGGRAPALWKSLNGKVSGLSAFQPFYVVTSGLTRLLVGPLGSAAEAQRLCARIKPTGTPCVPMSM